MKFFLVGVLGLASINSFAVQPREHYDCNENNILTYNSEARSVKVYEFGGAKLACNRIALKLNIQLHTLGKPNAYDCGHYSSGRYNQIVSDLGVVFQANGDNNFICTQLALNLNKNL